MFGRGSRADSESEVTMNQVFYCVLGYEDNCFCWWSLAPTEDDSWAAFARGCVDADPVNRAKADGCRCVRVRLVVDERDGRIAELEAENARLRKVVDAAVA